MRSRLREDRGQATVEFALVLPLLLLCALLVLHVGVTVVVQVRLEHVAREAARAAAVEPAAASAAASRAAAEVDGEARISVRIDGDWVRVEVERTQDLVPFLGVAGSRTLRSEATMRREDRISP